MKLILPIIVTTRNPGVGDNKTKGNLPGQFWVNNYSNRLFVCLLDGVWAEQTTSLTYSETILPSLLGGVFSTPAVTVTVV